MAKVALVPVPAAPHRLVLVAGIYLALVVGVGVVIALAALPVDKLLAYFVCGQLLWLSRSLASPARSPALRTKCVYVSRIVCQFF